MWRVNTYLDESCSIVANDARLESIWVDVGKEVRIGGKYELEYRELLVYGPLTVAPSWPDDMIR